jgi:hypothetical protein
MEAIPAALPPARPSPLVMIVSPKPEGHPGK